MPIDQKEWEQEVRDVFEKMKTHQEPYDISVDGVDITILPNVFSPAYFTDSAWFTRHVSRIAKDKTLLEIGTGTGIVALFVALNGATVTATDISPDAVENAKLNFEKYGIDASVYLGNMYEPIPTDSQFDIIFWNHPFNKGDNPDEEILLQSGFDYNYNSLKQYLGNAERFLKPNGQLLLGTGNFAKLDEVEKIASEAGYEMELLVKEDMPLAASSEIDNDYRIYSFFKN